VGHPLDRNQHNFIGVANRRNGFGDANQGLVVDIASLHNVLLSQLGFAHKEIKDDLET
jgi:hypothetical protein